MKPIRERSKNIDTILDFKCIPENSQEYNDSTYEVQSDLHIDSDVKIKKE